MTRYLLRSCNVLNVVMALLVAVFAYNLSNPRHYPSDRINSPRLTEAAAQNKEEAPPAQTLSPNDYAVIGEQNLFHPLRLIPVEKPPGPPPPPPPEFVLYGTLVTDSTSVAYMEDRKAPQSTAGRGKRQVSLKKGEMLSGFTVRDIDAEKVVMVRGEENITVRLNDSQKPRTRDVTAAGAPGQSGQQGQPQPQQLPQAAQRVPPAAQQIAPQPPAQVPQSRQKEALPPPPTSPDDARKTFLDFFKRGR